MPHRQHMRPNTHSHARTHTHTHTHTNATQVEADRRTYIEAVYTELNAAGDGMSDDAQVRRQRLLDSEEFVRVGEERVGEERVYLLHARRHLLHSEFICCIVSLSVALGVACIRALTFENL